MIEDSKIVCGRHRKSRRYVGALSIPMTKPDSRRRPDHLDEQFETVWFVWNPELFEPAKIGSLHAAEGLSTGLSR